MRNELISQNDRLAANKWLINWLSDDVIDALHKAVGTKDSEEAAEVWRECTLVAEKAGNPEVALIALEVENKLKGRPLPAKETAPLVEKLMYDFQDRQVNQARLWDLFLWTQQACPGDCQFMVAVVAVMQNLLINIVTNELRFMHQEGSPNYFLQLDKDLTQFYSGIVRARNTIEYKFEEEKTPFFDDKKIADFLIYLKTVNAQAQQYILQPPQYTPQTQQQATELEQQSISQTQNSSPRKQKKPIHVSKKARKIAQSSRQNGSSFAGSRATLFANVSAPVIGLEKSKPPLTAAPRALI